ncbi:hypothetical protein [Nesterenkonia suensis]
MDAIIGFLNSISADAWTAVFTGGLFVTALATAIYAHQQWKSSREHHEAQVQAQAEAIRPYVLVTVETSRAAFNLFDLVIRNIGKRPAVDVEISLDPAPVRAREMDDPEIQMQNMKMLNEPMSLLAPDQEIRAFYDNHIERRGRDDLPDEHLATVTYKDMSGTTYTTEFTLDILALKGMSHTSVGTIHEVSKSLEKITKILSSARILQRSPDLVVHAVTEPRSRHEFRDLQDRQDSARRSLNLVQQLTRGREKGQFERDLIRRAQEEQERLVVEPLQHAILRCRSGLRFAWRSAKRHVRQPVRRGG